MYVSNDFLLEKEKNYQINEGIRGCCNGSKNTAYGYIWRYIDNDNNIINDGYKKKEERIFKIEDIV